MRMETTIKGTIDQAVMNSVMSMLHNNSTHRHHHHSGIYSAPITN